MMPPFKYRLSFSVLVILLLGACSDGGYYLQAVGGQYKILSNRQPISALLENDHLSSQQRLKLSQILQIRDFASEQLALPENGSYRSYVELEQPYPIWNVVAAPEFSLQPKTWCFPIAGCISYRGYFSESAANEFARKLQTEGYDTLVAGIPAYSTLSWFDDPVLSSFSHWPAPAVARLIFHELAHQKLYLPGDSDFNEAFATSVELAGTTRWLQAYGSDKERRLFKQQLERETTFIAWAEELHQELKQLYALPLTDRDKRVAKKDILKTARMNYQKIKTAWGGYRGYDRWVETLNNARLVSLQTYRRLLPGFRALLNEHQQDFAAFYKSCQELADRSGEQRKRQLAELSELPQLAVKE